MTIFKLGVFFIYFLTGFSFAATYYVDNNYGNDASKGTSSSSPWKTIARVNSFTFSPGDSILFKRGVKWEGTITVRNDGSSSNPIIYGSYGEGDLPLIDGGNSRSHGIYMDSRNYIIVQEFNIQNTTISAVRIQRSEYVSIKNNELYVTGRAGVFIEESENCLISGNEISTPSTHYDIQTDGIYGQKNLDNIYEGNNIVISNQHVSQHCDGIQLYLETNAVIKDNYIEQNNTKSGNAQGIYCSENSGTFMIFNNVAYGLHSTSGLIKFKNSSSTGKVEMIGNTIYGGKGGLVQTNDPDIVFKNNIVVTTGNNALVIFDKSISNKTNIDFNLYNRKGTGAAIVDYNGAAYTFSKWKSVGFDKNSLENDPEFEDASIKDFTLKLVSPALNKGVNLISPYNVDKDGIARPIGIRSDIGAFELNNMPKFDGMGNNSFPQTNTPEEFDLEQNYPNPFNPSTTINFSLPENSMVSLKIYDITGREVAVLINDIRNAGVHQVTFDASNLSSGTYVYQITAKDFIQTRKMILLK